MANSLSPMVEAQRSKYLKGWFMGWSTTTIKKPINNAAALRCCIDQLTDTTVGTNHGWDLRPEESCPAGTPGRDNTWELPAEKEGPHNQRKSDSLM